MGSATRRAVDRALASHEQRLGRINEALVALDGHPGRILLDHLSFTGRTRREVEIARVGVVALHRSAEDCHLALTAAREGPGRTRRWAASSSTVLDAVLGGRPDESTARGQLSASDAVAALLSRLEADYEVVASLVSGIAEAWVEVAKVLDELDRELADLDRSLAAQDVSPADLAAVPPAAHDPEAIRIELARLRRASLSDPLPHGPDRPLVDPRALGRLHGDVDVLRRRIDSVAALLDDPLGRRERALAVIAERGRAETELAVLDRRVRRVVHCPRPPAHAHDVAASARRVDDALALAEAGQRLAAAMDIDAVEAEARHGIARAATERDARIALLERHVELGGRLRGYRAKARCAPSGATELLAARAREAEEQLAREPCDLGASAWALLRLQEAVVEASP